MSANSRALPLACALAMLLAGCADYSVMAGPLTEPGRRTDSQRAGIDDENARLANQVAALELALKAALEGLTTTSTAQASQPQSDDLVRHLREARAAAKAASDRAQSAEDQRAALDGRVVALESAAKQAEQGNINAHTAAVAEHNRLSAEIAALKEALKVETERAKTANAELQAARLASAAPAGRNTCVALANIKVDGLSVQDKPVSEVVRTLLARHGYQFDAPTDVMAAVVSTTKDVGGPLDKVLDALAANVGANSVVSGCSVRFVKA